jgi:hypothetical protein
VAALSTGHPLGMVSVVTLAYAVGAGLLWLAGFRGLQDIAGDGDAAALLPLAALLWTAAIGGYLVWSFLTRHDEARLLRELDRWDARSGSRVERPEG